MELLLKGRSYDLGAKTLHVPASIEALIEGGSSTLLTRSPWAYRCVSIRAKALASIPWRIVGPDGNELDRHPMIDYLAAGQEFGWDFSDLIRTTEIDLLTSGAAYWRKAGLQRLNPTTMTVRSNSQRLIGFEQRIGASKTPFDADEIVQYRLHNPSDDIGPGIAPLKVCEEAIEVDRLCDLYIADHLRNHALPGVLLHTEQQVPEAEANRIVKGWESKFGGRKQGSVGIADRGLEATILTPELGKLALENVRAEARRSICAALGVPQTIAGADEAANFATAQTQLQLFHEGVIVAEAEFLAGVVNEQLAPEFGNVTFEWNYADVPALREDQDQLATRLGGLVRERIITPEAAARELGFAPEDVPVSDAGNESDDLAAWRRKALKARSSKAKALT